MVTKRTKGRGSMPWPDFWHALNVAVKPRQRRDVNEWHARLWNAMDRMRDELRGLEDSDGPRFERMWEQFERLKDAIEEVPWLEP